MSRAAHALKNTGLFEGIEENEIDAMLKCVGAYSVKYAKDDFVFRRGDHTDCIGVITKGSVRSIREDWWGNRTVLADMREGSILGTEYACAMDKTVDVSMVATEQAEVMFLDVDKVSHMCSSSCPFHGRMVTNLIQILAQTSQNLGMRLDQMAKRSTREKLCAYLSDQARRAGSSEFMIAMNRQELADYLGVDRSAMSAELSRMQRDGIVEYERNHFILK